MLKLFAGTVMFLSLAAGIATASAAETGTKTFPTSSIYPPRTPPPVWGYGPRTHHRPMYNYVRHHHQYCYLPSGRCGNNHRVEN
jgi:hypothetical protein